MKIVTAEEMKRIESNAFAAGKSEKSFMEAAGRGVATEVKKYVECHGLTKNVTMLCGKGNNAGDAYVVGLHLVKEGFFVTAIQVFPLKTCSKLCVKNAKAFSKKGGKIVELSGPENIAIPREGILLDGLLGTGFEGQVDGILAQVIEAVNSSSLPVISIDIPSGINGNNGKAAGAAIAANKTIFLGLPKVGLFLKEGFRHSGKLVHVDFGLGSEFVGGACSDFELVTRETVSHMLPAVIADRHKYEAGYVIGLAGSSNMPGAALLSSLAALRGGAGIVRLLHSSDMACDFFSTFPELIRQKYNYKDISEVLETMNSASATFVGPGIGREMHTRNLLLKVLAGLKKPCVIDADALNIISEEEQIILPADVIMTPHLGEMHRLLRLKKERSVDEIFLVRCQEYCEEKGVTLVLKGGPTFIFHPGEKTYVVANGDPGMATAGSGDVLTGLLASLLAQRLSPHHAALLGTFMHCLAGSSAACAKTSYSIIASDIIDHFPFAFREMIK